MTGILGPLGTPRHEILEHARCKIVFGDTETTSTRRQDRRIWNIGLIRREPDGTQESIEIIVDDVDLAEADPHSLRVGHFWDRHPR